MANPAELIDFSRLSPTNSMRELIASSVDTADGVLITTGAASSVLLTDVSLANLSDAEFLFV